MKPKVDIIVNNVIPNPITIPSQYSRIIGDKEYELKDHLGNIRVTLSDARENSTTAKVTSATSYLPFGMVEPNVFTSSGHRYGYNGTHENDNEIAGDGNNLDFGGFGYDPRVARRWNREPLSAKYPHLAGYVILGNNPIYYADGDGNDIIIKGKNNSSITFKTNAINFSVNASSLGINFGGNHILKGEELLSAALDIAGIIDPTGAADGANAILQARNGDYFSAGISVIGLALPGLGDLAKAPKIAKDIKIIETAIEKGAKVLKEGADELGGAVGKGAKKEKARFIGDKDGTLVDTKTTPKGSYQQPDGSRTDVLQDKPHYDKKTNTNHGTSHTHEPFKNTNPKTGETRTGVGDNTHKPTFKEVKNIESGKATPKK